MGSITVQHLLQHMGGWNRVNAINPNGGSNFDPWGWVNRAAPDMEVDAPASATTIAQWMRGKPLQFTPGSGFVYPNTGSLVLSRVIKAITGLTHESYVQSLFRSLGITRMRIGRSSLMDRHHGEVVCYDYPINLSIPAAYLMFGEEPRSGNPPLPCAYSRPAGDAGACRSR